MLMVNYQEVFFPHSFFSFLTLSPFQTRYFIIPVECLHVNDRYYYLLFLWIKPFESCMVVTGTYKCCYGVGDLNVYFMPKESRRAWAELASI